MIALAIFLLFISTLLYFWWLQTFSRFFRLLKKVPGPEGYPIVGNLLDFFATPEELFKIDRRLHREYYPIYKEWTFNYAAVNICHPDDIEAILSSNRHIDKGIVYDFLHAWLGTGLLTSGGVKWQTRRKILTPAFHFTILQEFVPIFNEETRKMVEVIKRSLEDPVDVIQPVTKLTLLSIADTSMGVKLDASVESCEDYKNAIYTFGEALIYRLLRPWFFNELLYNFK